jgi:hypothetical protein
VEFFPTHQPEIHRSHLNFLDNKEHQATMPLAKIDLIRMKQSEIISALVTLVKYTGKVYKQMTPYQFQLELQTVVLHDPDNN